MLSRERPRRITLDKYLDSYQNNTMHLSKERNNQKIQTIQISKKKNIFKTMDTPRRLKKSDLKVKLSKKLSKKEPQKESDKKRIKIYKTSNRKKPNKIKNNLKTKLANEQRSRSNVKKISKLQKIQRNLVYPKSHQNIKVSQETGVKRQTKRDKLKIIKKVVPLKTSKSFYQKKPLDSRQEYYNVQASSSNSKRFNITFKKQPEYPFSYNNPSDSKTSSIYPSFERKKMNFQSRFDTPIKKKMKKSHSSHFVKFRTKNKNQEKKKLVYIPLSKVEASFGSSIQKDTTPEKSVTTASTNVIKVNKYKPYKAKKLFTKPIKIQQKKPKKIISLIPFIKIKDVLGENHKNRNKIRKNGVPISVSLTSNVLNGLVNTERPNYNHRRNQTNTCVSSSNYVNRPTVENKKKIISIDKMDSIFKTGSFLKNKQFRTTEIPVSKPSRFYAEKHENDHGPALKNKKFIEENLYNYNDYYQNIFLKKVDFKKDNKNKKDTPIKNIKNTKNENPIWQEVITKTYSRRFRING